MKPGTHNGDAVHGIVTDILPSSPGLDRLPRQASQDAFLAMTSGSLSVEITGTHFDLEAISLVNMT